MPTYAEGIFQLKTTLAVFTGTFATQEERHSWASVASFGHRFLSAVAVVVPILFWAVVVVTQQSNVGHAVHFLPICIEFGLVSLAIFLQDELQQRDEQANNRPRPVVHQSPTEPRVAEEATPIHQLFRVPREPPQTHDRHLERGLLGR
ncbi:hypothetical protein CMUS01_13258 [Colletotrichum musicola]|uniref:Transmembrane protein n=1 Tax=Colletotrichum musicola TaxID=2175873 RepID=A0A8H6JE80_9PEZI|nr:hypothetical protein CMUS01_13258 [Colletotrichum musicola]